MKVIVMRGERRRIDHLNHCYCGRVHTRVVRPRVYLQDCKLMFLRHVCILRRIYFANIISAFVHSLLSPLINIFLHEMNHHISHPSIFGSEMNEYRKTVTRPDEYGVEETVTDLVPGMYTVLIHLTYKWSCPKSVPLTHSSLSSFLFCFYSMHLHHLYSYTTHSFSSTH